MLGVARNKFGIVVKQSQRRFKEHPVLFVRKRCGIGCRRDKQTMSAEISNDSRNRFGVNSELGSRHDVCVFGKNRIGHDGLVDIRR